MENFKLVLPEHLNHYGYLFGGQLLKWVDESAYIAARLDYPESEFVTVAMDQSAFLERVNLGEILRIEVKRQRVGRTSVVYQTTVNKALAKEGHAEGALFSTTVTFVCIGPDGGKRPLPTG